MISTPLTEDDRIILRTMKSRAEIDTTEEQDAEWLDILTDALIRRLACKLAAVTAKLDQSQPPKEGT